MNETVDRAAQEPGSESPADVWKQALADYDGRRFVSWAAAEQELEDLFRARARALPSGVTAQHLLEVARKAEWLKEDEGGMVVLRIPADWWETQVSPSPPRRKSALSE